MVGRPTVISYFLTNSGDASAMNIRLEDGFPEEAFDAVENISESGKVIFEIPEIPAGDAISLNCTIMPKMEGVYNSRRAEIDYYNGDVVLAHDEEYDDEDQMLGFSSSPGTLHIISEEQYLSSTGFKLQEPLIFLVFGAISVLTPFVLWVKVPKRKAS